MDDESIISFEPRKLTQISDVVYQCDECKNDVVLTSKNNTLCKKCGNRVLCKKRINKRVEYVAR